MCIKEGQRLCNSHQAIGRAAGKVWGHVLHPWAIPNFSLWILLLFTFFSLPHFSLHFLCSTNVPSISTTLIQFASFHSSLLTSVGALIAWYNDSTQCWKRGIKMNYIQKKFNHQSRLASLCPFTFLVVFLSMFVSNFSSAFFIQTDTITQDNIQQSKILRLKHHLSAIKKHEIYWIHLYHCENLIEHTAVSQ